MEPGATQRHIEYHPRGEVSIGLTPFLYPQGDKYAQHAFHGQTRSTGIHYTPPTTIIARVVDDLDRSSIMNAYSEDIMRVYAAMNTSERNALVNMVEFEYANRGESWVKDTLSRHQET